MRCIWCKENSDSSKSIEHILPESLGNKKNTLPRGWVCDKCNNYFSRKIERPFLDSYYGRAIRFEAGIQNKRGRIPPAVGIHLESMIGLEIDGDRIDNAVSICPVKASDEEEWMRIVTQSKGVEVVFPLATEPKNDRVLSRFIAKMALEILASKCIHLRGWNDEIVNLPELDEIRKYVRLNAPPSMWPVHMRRIYPHGATFTEGGNYFEVLNEWNILITKDFQYFAVIVIFGVEYAINLAGPDLIAYTAWLQEHENKSPLYWNDENFGEPNVVAEYFK